MRRPFDDELALIPEHMRGAITRYIRHGIKPGDFLSALLEGDTRAAMARADSKNRAAFDVGAWGTFLRDAMPPRSWGSPAMVAAWMAHKGLDGIRRAE